MNRNPTNSSLERAFLCRLFPCLPRVNKPNVYSTDGQVWHRFKQRVVEIQAEGKDLTEARDLAVFETPELFRDALRAIPIERLRDLDLDPIRCAVEVAFAYDVATGKAREIGRGAERNYGTLLPTEYAGTTDYVALVGKDKVKIRDWKRGWSRRAPAERNKQLRKCALDACRAYGRTAADVEIVRLGDAGEPWFDQAELTPFALDEFALELEDLDKRIQSDRADYASGDLPEATVTEEGCAYCPGLPYCPATMAMLRAIAEGEEIQNLAGGTLLITPENAPRLALLVPQMRKRLELVEDALKLYAGQTPIPLPDGRVYGPRPDKGKTIANVPLAREILKKRLGGAPDGEKAPWELALSPEAMTLGGLEAARKRYFELHPDEKKVKGAVGKLDEELERLLHSAGALRVYDKPVMIAHKPKALPAGAPALEATP